MVNPVVEVLVVQLLVVPIELSDSRMEPDHKVLIFHEAFSLLLDGIRIGRSSLSVERAQDDTPFGVVLQAGGVSLQRALSELGVQIFRTSSGSLRHLLVQSLPNLL